MTVGRVNLRGQSVLLDTKTLHLRMQARKLTSRFVVCRAFQGVGTVEPPHNHRPANPNCVYLRIDATHAHHPSLPHQFFSISKCPRCPQNTTHNVSIQPNIYRMTYGTTTTQYDISYRLSAASYCDGAVAAGRVYKQWGIGLTCHCRPACAQGWPRPRLRPALLELCPNSIF